MGYELYREVKVWAPPSLTHREKLTAMVLADDANDKTRLTYSSVVDPEIMRQAMVKNQRDMLKIVARLQDEKVVEHAGGGHNGRIAKYRFLHLAPAVGPLKPGENHPPTDGKGVQNEPATPDVARSNQTPNTSEAHGEADQNEHPSADEGCSNRPRRVSETNTPTPSPPTTSSSPQSSPDTKSSTGQGGGGGEQKHQGPSFFVEALDYRGRRPSRSQYMKLAKLVADALGNGWNESDLKAYLALGDSTVKSAAAIYLHRLNPDELPPPPAPRQAPQAAPGCAHCDDGYYDTGNGWAPCPNCNRNAA